MRQAAALYRFLSTDLRETYERHPAFAGRKPRFKATVLFLVFAAFIIISYSTIILFV